jgi:hypothetical protein
MRRVCGEGIGCSTIWAVDAARFTGGAPPGRVSIQRRNQRSSEVHMNARAAISALVALNVAVLSLLLAQHFRATPITGELPVLRGRALEIVDDQGRVRASITVMPPSGSSSGGDQAETVLLRLITERGRPTVKIASSEPTSGLNFTGPTGTKDSYLILKADGTVSSLKLRNEDGSERVLSP